MGRTAPLRVLLRERFALVASALVLTSVPALPASAQTSPVQWTNFVYATATGSALQKAGGCGGCADAGATSVQALNQQDGFVEFTPGSGFRLYAGLGSNATSNTDPALIDFAFSFWPDGGWDVRERNVYRTEGRFVAGDVFRIAVVSGAVTYYQNGALVYTSLLQPAPILVLDTSLISDGAALLSAFTTAAPPTPISVVTGALPDGSLGQPYAATLQATGGTGSLLWSVSGGAPPAGVTMAPTGTLGGTPTSWGTAQFVVRATDANLPSNYGERTLSIVVPAPPNPVAIQTSGLPSTRLAQPYSTALLASGGTGSLVWAIVSGALPEGITLDTSTGIIHGSASTTGRFAITVKATDSANLFNTASQALSFSVLAGSPPAGYSALTDRMTRAKGTLPTLGAAGSTFLDPVFGSNITRITDGGARPGVPGYSYRTPSSSHANAWSADERYFYAVSTDGTIIPFSFDRVNGRAQRLQPSTTGDGGLTLQFFNEPTFSYIVPGIAYATFNGIGSNLRSVDQYDFETGQYSQLLNLDTLVPNLAGTYIGGIGVSAGPIERLIAFFGGTSQDRHFYLVVFDRANPGDRHLLDTAASTLDGIPTSSILNFKIHAANIDRSGRFVVINPTSADLQAPRSAAPVYVWDLETGTFTALPLVQAITGGHDAFGYGDRVNQDCCTTNINEWDAAQWQYRSLSTPLSTVDLVVPVLRPEEVYLADHPSWHNAQPDRLVPFLEASYRYGSNTTQWRPWDEEIMALQTEGAGSGATVWRFAHHRSAVANDADPSWIYFWYTPRVNISPDGQWALFTSNWEKTLGTDPRAEVGGRYRQDVFLISLKPGVAPVTIVTTTLPSGTASLPYSATLQASGGSNAYRWSITSGVLPPGLILDSITGSISGTPTTAGTASFTVRATDVSDASNLGDRSLTLSIAPAPLPAVVVTTTTLATGTVGKAYSATLQATGGTGSYIWSISAGTLPPGLSLSTTGIISGKPTAAGTTAFTVRAKDAAASGYADKALTITIASQPPAPVAITTVKLPDGYRNSAYSITIATSGGKLPFTWSITRGSLPPGLSLQSTTGTISGLPTETGTWTFTVRVVDSATPATSASKSFSIRIRATTVNR
jgi:large repetitive protein